MAFYQRTYLGLDIRQHELRLIAMQRRGNLRQIMGGRLLGLDSGLLQPGARELNISDMDTFSERLQELLDPISGREERVSVCLADVVGRQLVTEVETAFKSHQEGAEILRWQLKNSLPALPKDVQIDYQVLDQQENGRYRLLVAVAVRSVIEQYEEAFDKAGYQAILLDFHSANLYNWYRFSADLGDEFVLINIEGDTFGFRYVVDGRVVSQRSRNVTADPGLMYQEINRSLSGAREKHPEISRARVCLHSDWQDESPLVQAAGTVFGKDVISLNPRFERYGSVDLGVTGWRVRSLAAAAGAAERMM